MPLPLIGKAKMMLCTLLLGSAPAKSSVQTLVEATLKDLHSTHRLSGTVHVISGTESFSASVGNANDKTGEANRADTLFAIASITKHVVGAAILKLQEQGKLSTSDPLSKFFPEYPAQNLRFEDSVPIRLEHMAQLTAGLEDVYELDQIKDRVLLEHISFAELLNSIRSVGLKFAPGSQWEYGDTAFILLGEVIRRVSGLTFGEYVEANLFAPVGLNGIQVGTPTQGAVARSYIVEAKGRADSLEEHGVVDAHFDDHFSDGNIFSTAQGLAEWLKSLVDGKVLSSRSLAQMVTPSAASIANGSPYGYGLNIAKDANGRTYFTHGGSWLSYKSFAIVYPDSGLIIVWLSNQEYADGQPDGTQLLRDRLVDYVSTGLLKQLN